MPKAAELADALALQGIGLEGRTLQNLLAGMARQVGQRQRCRRARRAQPSLVVAVAGVQAGACGWPAATKS